MLRGGATESAQSWRAAEMWRLRGVGEGGWGKGLEPDKRLKRRKTKMGREGMTTSTWQHSDRQMRDGENLAIVLCRVIWLNAALRLKRGALSEVCWRLQWEGEIWSRKSSLSRWRLIVGRSFSNTPQRFKIRSSMTLQPWRVVYHKYTDKNMQFTLQSNHNWSPALMLIGLVGGLRSVAVW